SANVRNVYGEPVSAHDRTLIPAARIGYGFGAGGRESGSGEGSASAPAGGGGGGGTGAIPVGVVEISATGTRFIRFYEPKMIGVALAAGLITGYILGRVGGRRSR